jgi:hypothetical protein
MQPSGISERSYHRIKLGMSEAEVEAIIGLPAGHHGPPNRMVVTSVWFLVGIKGLPDESWRCYRHESWPDLWRWTADENQPRGKVMRWSGYRIYLDVAFDNQGLVVGAKLVTEDWPKSRKPAEHSGT